VQRALNLAAELREPPAAVKMGLTAAAIATASIVSVVLVFRFADDEREREIVAWQGRLGIVAETRAAAVGAWLDRQIEEVSRLADNSSLQLYTGELAQSAARPGGGRNLTGTLAQTGYLQNLLAVAAGRAGFARPAEREIGANVPRPAAAGIALLDREGRVLASTAEMPPLDGRLAAFVRDANSGEPALLDIHPGPRGATMAFAAPVFAVHGDRDPARQTGWVLGVREVAPDLFKELRQPGLVWKSADVSLVRRRAGVVEYLSPGRDGADAPPRRLAIDTPELDTAFALANPEGFAVKRDHRGEAVLVTSRRIERAPWTLVVTVDRAEALAASEARLAGVVLSLLLAIALVAAAMVALWRHGASRRAGAVAEQLAALARRYESRGRLLRLVADSVPGSIFIVDGEGRLHFANRAAAARARLAPEDLVAKPLAGVFGATEAARYARTTRAAFGSGEPMVETATVEANGEMRTLRSEHVPLAATPEFDAGVLVVEHDITDAVHARERRERMLAGLLETVVAIVDQRDPHAANHSTYVSRVARAIAEEMRLDEVEVETAAIAGAVMNIGKVLVPAEVLTRAGGLSDDERRQVREAVEASADLLERVPFEGPVAQTLRQINEHWDGTGTPQGLRGEGILRTARVVAVANAFVALASPRSWRAGAGPDEAIALLLPESGRKYDRAVIAALVSRYDTRGAKADWRGLAPHAAAAT
jgi:PAS domain S-box-containing protein